MSSGRRAARALTGGFVVASALLAPAAFAAAAPVVPGDPTVSIACVDRVTVLASIAENGLGLTSVAPLAPALYQPAVPSTNPAVAVVSIANPTAAPFNVLIGRDLDQPVALSVAPGATAATAFDVAERSADGGVGTSVFRVTDPAGAEIAHVASTGDCSTPAAWCDAERAPGEPVAADNADLCPLPGDETLSIPEAPVEPEPTGRIVDGEPDVLGAQLFQAAPAPPAVPPSAPAGAIVVPPPAQPTTSPLPVEEEAAVAAPAPGEELARSGSQSGSFAAAATMMLGVGAVAVGAGRRRVDSELDERALAAMARISAVRHHPAD